MTATYGYNANNWITSLDHSNGGGSIAGFVHSYDKEGNKSFSKKTHDTGKSEAYEYDDIYRLIDYKVGTLVGSTVPVPITQRSYDLDKVGNWDQFTVDADGAGPGVPVDYNNTPNQMNEYDEDGSEDGIPDDFKDDKATQIADGEDWIHDDNGNRTEDGKRLYVYDDENRLVQVTRKSDLMVTGYRYDALGRRVVKTVDVSGAGVVTRYDYDLARVIEEQDDTPVTLATYVYGNYIDEVLTMHRGGQNYYYHQNALWSVVAVTDATANVVERYAYTDYGCVSVTDGAGNPVAENDYAGFKKAHSAIGNPYMFTGRRQDEESGVYYYRARYYDCEGGRFLQRDPLGYVDGVNLYEYVASSPERSLDPYGVKEETPIKIPDFVVGTWKTFLGIIANPTAKLDWSTDVTGKKCEIQVDQIGALSGSVISEKIGFTASVGLGIGPVSGTISAGAELSMTFDFTKTEPIGTEFCVGCGKGKKGKPLGCKKVKKVNIFRKYSLTKTTSKGIFFIAKVKGGTIAITSKLATIYSDALLYKLYM